jgi:DNA ligase (NAD+)
MEMQKLVDKLNEATRAYDEGHPLTTDEEWDKLYFELVEIEKNLGKRLSDSPTQKISYEVINQLKKVKHNHKMLSLNKTKDIDEVKRFAGDRQIVVMAKMDGLTCSLRYVDGKLISAETRGNGIIGEDVLHNAKVIKSIPKKINYKDELIIDGEIICTYNNFEKFSSEYKNPRNFAAGSIRLLDSKECASRNLDFVA